MLKKTIKKTAPFILSLCLVCSTVNAAEPDDSIVSSSTGVNEELALDDLFEVEILTDEELRELQEEESEEAAETEESSESGSEAEDPSEDETSEPGSEAEDPSEEESSETGIEAEDTSEEGRSGSAR